jgi:hypothetical protein
MPFCQAILPNSGLGNRLFSWARCSIFAEVNKIPMLAPHWTQFKIGPLLRRESDARIYNNLFVSDPYVKGLVGLWHHLRGTEIPEPEDPQLIDLAKLPSESIVTFRGERERFRHLIGWHQFLGRKLFEITRPRWIREIQKLDEIPIGIHIRRGDFRPQESPDDLMFKGGIRTPLKWFQDVLESIRACARFPVPARIFTDGKAEEIETLLKLPNVRQINTGSAISDLLALSRARILIGSGGSSFSAWASFIGEMPSMTHPGQPLTWFNLSPSNDRFIGEIDPSRDLPQILREQIMAALDHSAPSGQSSKIASGS